MLYETLLQGKMLLCFVFFGMICGMALGACKMFVKAFKKNRVATIVFDILFMLVFTALFLHAKIKYCYGEFRLFELLGYCLGIFLQQISINNLLEKFLRLSYNLIVKIAKKLKNSKFFGKIFR